MNKTNVLVKTSGIFKSYQDIVLSNNNTSFKSVEEVTLRNLAKKVVLYGNDSTNYQDIKVLNAQSIACILHFIIRDLADSGQFEFFKDEMLSSGFVLEVERCIRVLRMNDASLDKAEKSNQRLRDLKLIEYEFTEKLKHMSKDPILYLDESGLFKKATEILKTANGRYIPIDGDFKTFMLTDITRVESDFLNAIEAYKRIKLEPYSDVKTLRIEDLPCHIKNVHFSASHGLHNEIHGVLEDIFSKSIQFNDVAVMFVNKNELYSSAMLLKSLSIPYEYNGRISGKYSEIYSVISEVFSISKERFSSLRAIEKLSAYKRVSKYFKDNKTTSLFDFLNANRGGGKDNRANRVSFKELLLRVGAFISDVFNLDGKDAFTSEIASVLALLDGSEKDTLDNLKELTLSILEGVNINRSLISRDEARILLLPFNSVNIEGRSYIYILGLDSNTFNLKEVDSAILTDDEKKALGIEDRDFNMSKRQGELKTRKLLERLSLFSENKSLNLTLSYVSYDSVSTSIVNPSSFYMKAQNAYKVNDSSVKLVGFDSGVCIKETANSNINVSYLSENKSLVASATSVDTFMDCKRKFYYQRVLRAINDKRDENEGEWLDALEKGNLIHHVLSEYVNARIMNGIDVKTFFGDYDEFKKALLKRRDELKNRYTNELTKIDDDKELFKIFKGAVDDFYSNYPTRENIFNAEKARYEKAVLSEVNSIIKSLDTRIPILAECTFDSDVNINGVTFKNYRIDRIDYSFDDSLIVVDYKTNSSSGISKMKNKRAPSSDTLRQDYIYAYIINSVMRDKNVMNDKGEPILVKETEFRFVMSSDVLKTSLKDNDWETLLTDTMSEIRKCMTNNSFPRCTDEDSNSKTKCDYCDYKSICIDLIDENENNEKESE